VQGQYFVAALDGPPLNRHKPSAVVLLRSAAECAGCDVLAIVLSSMGGNEARAIAADPPPLALHPHSLSPSGRLDI
jgi:two-component system chemotaxis response regulator CheB